jgi:hypothetical protein
LVDVLAGLVNRHIAARPADVDYEFQPAAIRC